MSEYQTENETVQNESEQDFSERVSETAAKVWEKTEELTASASRFVKLKSAESKLKAAYAALGKYAYRHLRLNYVETENLNKTMDQIAVLREQVIALRREIEEEKKRKAEKKAEAKKQAKTEKKENA